MSSESPPSSSTCSQWSVETSRPVADREDPRVRTEGPRLQSRPYLFQSASGTRPPKHPGSPEIAARSRKRLLVADRCSNSSERHRDVRANKQVEIESSNPPPRAECGRVRQFP